MEKEQSGRPRAHGRGARPLSPRAGLHDLDDLSNRLLRTLTGQGSDNGEMPSDAILVARNIGPGELLDYDRTSLRGNRSRTGLGRQPRRHRSRGHGRSRSSLHAEGIATEALNGDHVMLDGDEGHRAPEAPTTRWSGGLPRQDGDAGQGPGALTGASATSRRRRSAAR